MSSGLTLGIDLGGTKIYGVAADRENRIIAQSKISTPAGISPEEMAQVITDFGRELLAPLHTDFSMLDGIGVAVPAPVDPETGVCSRAVNLGWEKFSMKHTLCSLTGREVCLENDGNLGALAEYTCGAAQGKRTVVGYYIGTGLGGGILLDGKIHSGSGGTAGELGHVVIRHGGRRCGCGQKGCAEAYCSKVSFVKALQKEVFKRGNPTCLPEEKFNRTTRNIKSRHLAKAYRAGDSPVCSVINRGTEMLGIAAASLCPVLAPDCIILGGGVISALGNDILPLFRRSFEQHLAIIPPEKITVALSALGDPAVALGAAIHARQQTADGGAAQGNGLV